MVPRSRDRGWNGPDMIASIPGEGRSRALFPKNPEASPIGLSLATRVASQHP